ncbi:MAG: hypothetical protein IT209_12735 [Armatimonadetes bacterium]|nr:hypothetical protein [Armatimonadota bacterium]
MLRQTRKWKALSGVIAAVFVMGFGAVQVRALDLGSVIKVGGIGFLVKQFGPDINKAINAAFGKKSFDPYDATKVVPIISLGNGGYVGAAQVQGPARAIDEVQAVGQIEVAFGNKSFRIKALVPVDSLNPTKVSRVKGTGVSAVIDVRI